MKVIAFTLGAIMFGIIGYKSGIEMSKHDANKECPLPHCEPTMTDLEVLSFDSTEAVEFRHSGTDLVIIKRPLK